MIPPPGLLVRQLGLIRIWNESNRSIYGLSARTITDCPLRRNLIGPIFSPVFSKFPHFGAFSGFSQSKSLDHAAYRCAYLHRRGAWAFPTPAFQPHHHRAGRSWPNPAWQRRQPDRSRIRRAAQCSGWLLGIYAGRDYHHLVFHGNQRGLDNAFPVVAWLISV